MRVVTGEAKGRKLKGPKTPGTRPIIDRVKTALFDILSTRVEDARFLDLFAGVGSVGIEALSRGAASATFIEMNYSVLKLVRENLKITGLGDRAETLHTDAFKFLQSYSFENQTLPKDISVSMISFMLLHHSIMRWQHALYSCLIIRDLCQIVA